jgi:uncharacterized protein with FMN-binding domain
MSGVEYKEGKFAGSAQLRAVTRVTLDGDLQVVVPVKDGEIDAALLAVHAEMLKQAQINRAEMLKAAVSAASSLLGTLK